MQISEKQLRAAVLAYHGDDFFDCFEEGSEFANEKVEAIRDALEAALSTDAEPVVHEDFKALFEECQLARDEIGFLGSVPDCIRYLDAEAKAAPPPAPSVAVKVLEWHEINTHGGRKISARSHGLEWRLDPLSRDLKSQKEKAQREFDAHIRSALSAQVQDVAGWQTTLPTYHQYPYVVENISGKWHLRIHHGNGSSHSISTHDSAAEAIAAAPAKQEGKP